MCECDSEILVVVKLVSETTPTESSENVCTVLLGMTISAEINADVFIYK